MDNTFFVKKLKKQNGQMFKEKIILNKSECQLIIDLCDDFKESQIIYDNLLDENQNIGELNKQKRNSETAKIKDLEKIKSFLLPRLKEFNIKNLPDNTRVLRYKKGSFFSPHTDRIGLFGNRKLTLIIQLSEKDSYEGGVLIIDNNPISKQIGNLVLFDSGVIHEVTKLSSGERFVLVSWIEIDDMILKSQSLI
jgi:predicted 2-oxoglutarate/Fe(II)-dependent dioxygenase YbiX